MPSQRPRAARRRAAPAPAPAARPRRARYLPLLGLFALVVAIYANSLANDFVFDDHTLLDFNPEVNPAIAGAIEQRAIEYRPFRTLSYVLDRQIGGHHPAAYRAGNLVYHALTGGLALAVYRQLGFSPLTALLGAAFFVSHPVQSESVAYVSGRRDVLCGLFVLLAFSFLLRWRAQRRWWQLALAGAALAMGALTKEVAFGFPLLVLAYDVTIAPAQRRPAAPESSRWAGARLALKEQRLVYLLLAGFTAAALAYFAVVGLPSERGWWGGTLATNFLNVALLWVHSAVVLLFPLRLLADYSFEAVPLIHRAAAPLAWAAVAALLALLALAWGQRQRAPRAAFLLFWSGAALLPSSHVFPHHDFWAEHYLYVPLFGFAGLLALAIARVGRQLGAARRSVTLAGALVVTLYGLRTVVRNRDWRDELTLWRVTSAAAPRCARARANHGGALLARTDLDNAEREFRASRAIKPLVSATSGLVMIAHAKGRFAERDRLLRRLETGRNVSYTNLLSLAGWFLINKEYPLALEVAQYAAKRPNADDRAATIEGWASARSGQLDQACALFEQALQRNSGSRDARAGRDYCRQQRALGN
ncbi:MAG: phospholipid carrier-dependent glycosyltransferase [Deltaproteobacteria bacterium]|nr:phospholipid carrier-dependent glycosyltransferase [Deltaproteobacteria bacterium]